MGATAGEQQEISLGQFLRYFLYLGTFGFGGPIATVGYMQRDLVERREWLDRTDFLDGVALGQTMPGPLAAQVVMWVGYLRAGTLGALATALAFILPSFIVVLLVAVLYVHYQGLSAVQSLFHGVAPAVIAIIALAAVKLARLTNGKDVRLWVISAVTMAVTALTGAEIAFMFLGAGLVMVAWDAPPRFLRRGSNVIAAAPLAHGLFLGAATAGTLVALSLFFLKAGAFIFGSGLAIVPFLRAGVVEQHHWLTATQFLDAVAMGLLTPGPVVISATFIGYLVARFGGAMVATVAIFIPIYLGVVIPGRWFVRHRRTAWVQAFVRGATAAAAGAIAGATVVLLRQAVVNVPSGGPALHLTSHTAVSIYAASIAVLSLVLVSQFKVKEPFVVLGAAVAGLLLFS